MSAYEDRWERFLDPEIVKLDLDLPRFHGQFRASPKD